MQKLYTIMVLIYWVMIFAIPMFLVLVSKNDFWLFRVFASREHNIQFLEVFFSKRLQCSAAAAYEFFIRLANFYTTYFAHV